MKLRTLVALALAAAFAAPLGAQTQSPGVASSGSSGPGAAAFDSLDKDKDGFVSHYEAKDSEWASRLREFDKDRDGKLSREEFAAMQAGGATGSGGKPDTPAAGKTKF
jgi:EF hand